MANSQLHAAKVLTEICSRASPFCPPPLQDETGPTTDKWEIRSPTGMWIGFPMDGLHSRRRDCHFDDTPFLSLLKHLIKVEGVQQNDSLADGQACSGWIASGGSRRMRGLAWQ